MIELTYIPLRDFQSACDFKDLTASSRKADINPEHIVAMESISLPYNDPEDRTSYTLIHLITGAKFVIPLSRSTLKAKLRSHAYA